MIFALNSHPQLEDSSIKDIYYLSSGGAPLPVEQVKAKRPLLLENQIPIEEKQ
jgi:hypothetical protein